MSELSPPALAALARLRRGMHPRSGDQARAWVRLGRRIAEAEHRPYVDPFWQRVRPRLLGMLPFLPAILIVVVTLSITPFMDPIVHGKAELEAARALIKDGHNAHAFEILVDHSRRFRTASAAEARMGLVLDALCGLKREERAQAELDRYLEMKPDSVHRDRLEELCPARD